MTTGDEVAAPGDDDSTPRRGLVRLSTVRAGETDPLTTLLNTRRSTKAYRAGQLSLVDLGSLLRHAAGMEPGDRRTYGSAHASYEVMVTVVTGIAEVEGLAPAAYRYQPIDHALVETRAGDHRAELARATLDAPWAAQCPVLLILSADLTSANRAFAEQAPERGERFCWLEAGLITQNVYLWAAQHDLGTVLLGGLDAQLTASACAGLTPPGHTTIALLPVGRAAEPR